MAGWVQKTGWVQMTGWVHPLVADLGGEMIFKMSGELSLATLQSKLRAKWLDSNPWAVQEDAGLGRLLAVCLGGGGL